MGARIFDNFFVTYLSRSISTLGAVNIYLDVLPTDESGWLEINPSSTNKREIVYYSAKGLDYVVVEPSGRGVGGTVAQEHSQGSEVRMNVIAEMLEELSTSTSFILGAEVVDAGGVNIKVSAWEGEINGNQVIYPGTVSYSLINNANNYVELSASGVLSSSTAGFSSDKKRLAIVNVVGGDITSIADKRQFGSTTNNFVNSISIVGSGLSLSNPTGHVALGINFDNVTIGLIGGQLAVRNAGIDLTTKVINILTALHGGTGQSGTNLGDFLVGNGVGWTRISMGLDSQTLVADSSVPLGVRWGAGGGGGPLVYMGL